MLHITMRQWSGLMHHGGSLPQNPVSTLGQSMTTVYMIVHIDSTTFIPEFHGRGMGSTGLSYDFVDYTRIIKIII
jgi:hypothetical protein